MLNNQITRRFTGEPQSPVSGSPNNPQGSPNNPQGSLNNPQGSLNISQVKSLSDFAKELQAADKEDTDVNPIYKRYIAGGLKAEKAGMDTVNVSHAHNTDGFFDCFYYNELGKKNTSYYTWNVSVGSTLKTLLNEQMCSFRCSFT